jgi:hypothetical protein
MHYRLFVGEKWATNEKVFKGRTGHGCERLCLLEDQINKDDDTLRVGVELLETINEMDAQSYALRDADDDEPVGQQESLDSPNLGSMVFHRHVNHRLVPQIRKEIERLGARLVRRVEWNVEQASQLSHYFQVREAICSPAFACGGVEGMQLIFYPSGYTGATAGFCSLYLYCPAGVTLRSQLHLGNQVRDINHYYEEAGAFGRVNFCRYENLWDPKEDTINLSFQVIEISQEQGSTATHVPAKGGPAAASAIKMLRVPAKESLVDTKVLPALWTAKGLGDLTTPDEGFEYFSAMSTRRETAAVKAANPFRPLASGAKIVARSESTPSFHKTHPGPTEPDLVMPPAQTTSAGWPGGEATAQGGSTGSLPFLKPTGGRKGSGGPVVPLPPASLHPSNMSPLGSMNVIPYVAGFT